jgi:hypothetical protein
MSNFIQVVSNLAQGAVVERLSRKMKELVKICERTHQSGELTLNIKFKPSKDGNVMSIISSVKVKEPAGEPIEGFLFADVDGNLTKEDPTDLFKGALDKQSNVQRIALGQNTKPERVEVNTEIAE